MKKKIFLSLMASLAFCLPMKGTDDVSGYLLVYFTGDDPRDEAINYALSRDGQTFKSLNDNAPILDSRLISETGSVRDPKILRSKDRKQFYMVATEMASEKGSDSNHGPVVLKSTDLVHWTLSVANDELSAFIEKHKPLASPKPEKNNIKGAIITIDGLDFLAQDGTMIQITDDEYRRLEKAFPSAGVKLSNPVLPEFHADPEILLSKNTGKYYIYSTTDGFPKWGGTYYTCYSSDNMRDWNYEGVTLDASTESIPWAEGFLWAPALEEKLIDGKYIYFLYFSAKPKEGDAKQIGVAVADSPTGPFKALPEPMITKSPVGRGQQIDVDVFTDPVSGKPYLYWGNGYMAGAELNPDMTSIKEETITVMTPEGGTLQDYRYREAPYAFYKDGKYYFMWSVDDTGAANYHVAYGTSDSPLGPITVAERPIVLIQNPNNDMIGTAHNSVLRVPGNDGEADRWYIVYHRIHPDYKAKENGPGYHREVCISPLKFNPDGTIMEVSPKIVN